MENFSEKDHLNSEIEHGLGGENGEEYELELDFVVQGRETTERLAVTKDHSRVVSLEDDMVRKGSATIVWFIPASLQHATGQQIVGAYQEVAKREDSLSLDGGQLNAALTEKLKNDLD